MPPPGARPDAGFADAAPSNRADVAPGHPSQVFAYGVGPRHRPRRRRRWPARGFGEDSAGVLEQLDPALDALGHGDSEDLAVRMAHDAAPELRDLCLVEPVLLIGAEVVEAVREVDGHDRAVVAHQEERAAEALFLPGCGDDALLEEAGGVLDVLRLDLSERHAGMQKPPVSGGQDVLAVLSGRVER